MSGQRPNQYLSAAHYALTAFDPEQSASFPYPVRRGDFRFDLLTLPRLTAGPVNIMNVQHADELAHRLFGERPETRTSNALSTKLVWTGDRISDDAAAGARSSPYEGGDCAPAVKVGTGTGSTPTLMGFGDDEDHLVVITGGRNRMNLVAFWPDEIPEGFTQQDGTLSERIADQIPVTAGLDPSTPWIQSEVFNSIAGPVRVPLATAEPIGGDRR